MPAPLAKGLIIAASVIVAAGLALYESPQVRQWVDQSRRKIAIALHHLGDEIQPRSRESTSETRSCSRSRLPAHEAEEERKRRQQESIRRSRAELIRKAREEGVAVDLDELAKLGTELHELQHPPPRPRANTADLNRSFDELVGADGKLKQDAEMSQAAVITTGAEGPSKDHLRFRGRGIEGFQHSSVYSNPFADDEGSVQFDRRLIGVDDDPFRVDSQEVSAQLPPSTRESSATLSGDALPGPAQASHLVSLSDTPSPHPEATQTASIHSIPSQTSHFERPTSVFDNTDQCFHSVHSSLPSTPARSRTNTLSHFTPGNMTPTDDGFSTSASVVGSHADDIAHLSEALHSETEYDVDDAISEAFSEVGAGQSTPGSWTDVDSEVGSEFGGPH